MSQLSQEMDRVFDDFWGAPFGRLVSRGDGWGNGGDSSALWLPDIEVHAHEGEIVVRADLPGLRREDVQVDVTDDMLTISGERRQQCDDREFGGGYRSECRYGSFFRSIPLPPGVKADQVSAEFSNGVLEVRMPSTEQRRENRRSIQVREPADGQRK